MTDILIAVGLVIQGCILYFVWPAKAQKMTPEEKVYSAEVHAALQKGVRDCGLNHDTPLSADLMATGKIGEILFHASGELGKPIRSMQDLHDLLVK
jgi:hypothetical protein